MATALTTGFLSQNEQNVLEGYSAKGRIFLRILCDSVEDYRTYFDKFCNINEELLSLLSFRSHVLKCQKMTLVQFQTAYCDSGVDALQSLFREIISSGVVNRLQSHIRAERTTLTEIFTLHMNDREARLMRFLL